MTIPRSDYPRPQFVRHDWLCLNGPWQFEMDPGDSGVERGMLDREFSSQITVPFCPESELSGIGHTDFMAAVWYRRAVTIPADWAPRRVLLHFQAVDYDATVWVNGQEVGRHRGGWSGFTCDLSGVVVPGDEVTIVVRARDDHRQPKPMGKQSQRHANYGCHYTRTTGIWQSVWLEPVPEIHLNRPRITPDVANGCFYLDQPISSNRPGLTLRARLKDGAGDVCSVSCPADVDLTPRLTLPIPESHRQLWSPEDPHLYMVDLELFDADGQIVDRARSYSGLRSVAIDGKTVKINGKAVFQRLVLDQGYYPDGIMTAPSDKALIQDIKLSMDAGFNGARLHQKVFEERFLYHADQLGYLVWGEFGDWGCAGFGPPDDHQQHSPTYITQWLEVLHRDYSHPCIVGWCPLNETYQPVQDRIRVLDDVTRGMVLATKAMDTTRPVLDTSGYSHRVPESDIYDSHDYAPDANTVAAHQAGLAEGKPFNDYPGDKVPRNIAYRGQPYFVSEFGGIWWNPDAKPGEASWGYGDRPKTIEEFYQRFESLCRVLLDNPLMFGYCYTQLTDVFQEQNGVIRFDRRLKFDMARLRAIQQRPAAIEQAHKV